MKYIDHYTHVYTFETDKGTFQRSISTDQEEPRRSEFNKMREDVKEEFKTEKYIILRNHTAFEEDD